MQNLPQQLPDHRGARTYLIGFLIGLSLLTYVLFFREDPYTAKLTQPVDIGQQTAVGSAAQFYSLNIQTSGNPGEDPLHAMFWNIKLPLSYMDEELLTAVPGISSNAAAQLLQQGIANAKSWQEVDDLPGIGSKTLGKLQQFFYLGLP